MKNELFNIGQIEAEEDNLLDEAFIKTEHYTSVLDPNIYLVIGRKGSGKTALFKTINNRELDKYKLILQIKPEDINPEQFQILEEHIKEIEGFPKGIFIMNMWKTFIWANIMKQIGINYQNRLAVSSNTANIYNYVTNNKWIEPDFISRFVRYAIKILLEIKKRMKNKTNSELLLVLENFPFGDPDFKKAKSSTKRHLSNNRALILIDQIDNIDAQQEQSDPKMKLFYEHLISSTRSLHQEKAFDLKLAISTDIFYGLGLRHLDKIMGHSYEILWSKESLKQFIIKRLTLSPSCPKGLVMGDPELVWGRFFDNTNKIRIEHDWRYAYKSFDYMYFHTFRRPRDFMLSCQQINEITATPLGIKPAGTDEVKRGVKKFCEVAQVYLRNEYLARCPSFDAINVFYDGEKVMSIEYFKEQLKEACPQSLTDEDLFDLVKVFYEMSAIGASYDKQLTAVYWYNPPKGIRFSYESVGSRAIIGCQSVVFHPVLAEALNMYRGSPKPPFTKTRKGRK